MNIDDLEIRFGEMKHALEFIQETLTNYKKNVMCFETFAESAYFHGVSDGYDSALQLINMRLIIEIDWAKKEIEKKDQVWTKEEEIHE